MGRKKILIKSIIIIIIFSSVFCNVQGAINSPPIVNLIYPKGGELITGILTIKWSIISSYNIKEIFIYYNNLENENWIELTEIIQTNKTKYEWNTEKVTDGVYRIQISVQDSRGETDHDTSGTFIIDNTPSPPEIPEKPSGPTRILANTNYTYITSTVDPEGDNVYYLFRWGPFMSSGWLGPYESGVVIQGTNSWLIPGSFSIQVKAKDEGGLESDWSEPLSVTVPRNRINNIFLKEIFNVLLLKVMLRGKD